MLDKNKRRKRIKQNFHLPLFFIKAAMYVVLPPGAAL
jgi:hypothetical protein